MFYAQNIHTNIMLQVVVGIEWFAYVGRKSG